MLSTSSGTYPTPSRARVVHPPPSAAVPDAPAVVREPLFGAERIWQKLKHENGGPKKNLRDALANDVLLNILASEPPNKELSEDKSIALLLAHVRLADEISSHLVSRDRKDIVAPSLKNGAPTPEDPKAKTTFIMWAKETWGDFKTSLNTKRQWVKDLRGNFILDIKLRLTGQKLPIPCPLPYRDDRLLKLGRAQGVIFGGSGRDLSGSVAGIAQSGEFYGRTEYGLGRYKDRNEDGFFAINVGKETFLVVIDEMGSYKGSGDCRLLISAALIQAIGAGKNTTQAIEYAKKVLKAGCAQGTGSQGMGAVVSILRVDSKNAVSRWLGDARARRFDGIKIKKLTKDHATWKKHILKRSLGLEGGEILHHQPDRRNCKLKPGNVLCMYTDGMQVVTDKEMARLIATSQDLKQAFERIWDLSTKRMEAGGRADNRTLLLLQCQE